MTNETDVTVIGAGLAGCEAAYKIAESGYTVTLCECKPITRSPAHTVDTFAELVCSNSLKSDEETTAGGALKRELRALGSLLLSVAETCRVPAGGALAVDRELFTQKVTDKIGNHKNIKIEHRVVSDWGNGPTVLATGPLTVGDLADTLKARVRALSFFDAAAPVIAAESVDMNRCFSADRYGKGDSDYLNCPLDKEEYTAFIRELTSAQCAKLHEFEKKEIFEGCMPIEIMAKRGEDTVRFGPLRPVGFTDPRTGKRPYAVVQLRAENKAKTMYNLVGFQTNLTFGEQKRVFSMIPALEHAEFLRYGVMHRNTYVHAPEALDAYSRLLCAPNVFVAGQLSGVEGYVESMASGLLCGINAVRLLCGKPLVLPPETTVLGALMRYLSAPNENFQPMNANFGLLPPLAFPERDKQKRKAQYVQRALADLREFQKANDLV
ncbi:MAG: methylenetetrahydrofolate--tRNA-(uracil(54)-C(5))-methyltransferase (FADH(2)-oxidizing) TrmFO [Clostridiales bacterium]|nr:methylenetetrahydrofolate--tRNA-(uracil(54)-C(5))-methyltransferase (FADH(2)-oxidizing) TrmFO [Clostridiales bacterium]